MFLPCRQEYNYVWKKSPGFPSGKMHLITLTNQLHTMKSYLPAEKKEHCGKGIGIIRGAV